MKNINEVKDPIHAFIKFDASERDVIDSRPLQRLRYIHQLSLAYLVYPGATHRRFEHSLGVMELASRVYDSIISGEKITEEIKKLIPELNNKDKLMYWRRVIRMAALCHDIGHLPFSHAAESELLPIGWDHERLTEKLILDEQMKSIWENMVPPLKPEHIVKLALGPRHLKETLFTDWETILSEIFVEDAFGVDRMDYLLRDAYHTGVVYGKFDHHRLIDTLKIVTPPYDPDRYDKSVEPSLGVEMGGLSSAEALLLSRYFMYSQVYFHPVNCIYSIHLKDFLIKSRNGKSFPIDVNEHLLLTDNEVTTTILETSRNSEAKGHASAVRLVKRQHFKELYRWNPRDAKENPNAAEEIYKAAKDKFGAENVRFYRLPYKGNPPDFFVFLKDSSVQPAKLVSPILSKIPVQNQEYVFIEPALLLNAEKWRDSNRKYIIEIK